MMKKKIQNIQGKSKQLEKFIKTLNTGIKTRERTIQRVRRNLTSCKTQVQINSSSERKMRIKIFELREKIMSLRRQIVRMKLERRAYEYELRNRSKSERASDSWTLVKIGESKVHRVG